MTQDHYTELAAHLDIARAEAKGLVLANLYGPGRSPGRDFSSVERTVADAMKYMSGGEDAPWLEDEDSHPKPTESGSGAASENHMSLETIMAITGDDSVRARRVSDGEARFLEWFVGGADDSKEAGA